MPKLKPLGSEARNRYYIKGILEAKTKTKHITQEDIGDMWNVTQSTVSKKLNRLDISITEFVSLAKKLDMTDEEWIGVLRS